MENNWRAHEPASEIRLDAAHTIPTAEAVSMDFRAGKSAAKISVARSDLSADRLGCDDFVNGPHLLNKLIVLIESQRLRAV